MHSTNNSQRKHIARKIYTPTQQPSATIAKYYLLFFNETETYQIVAKSSIKCVDDHGIATITINKKQIKGKIILTNSFDECEKEMSRRTRLSQQDNNNDFDSQKDDADVENDVVTVDTQHQISTQSQFPHDLLARLNYESASDDSEKENEKYNEDDELSDQYVKSIKKRIQIKENPQLIMLNKVVLDQYRDQTNEEFDKELMYEDTNLLRTVASSFGDFARKTMRLVFNAHELTTQILPPQRHYLARTSLNEKKFQLVNDAIRIKFKIDSTKYAAFYKNILRRKLSDFLIEERRRGLKRIGRDHIQNETMENSS
ncbi:unnamed protein product [Adineta steineri]|uniref:BEN domain-containing protein n=1 Tax=Adineta steineri TaxID=433720 RepID=A0A815REP4_9BILA|nr:unnamed protein product [Adineta steineri]